MRTQIVTIFVSLTFFIFVFFIFWIYLHSCYSRISSCFLFNTSLRFSFLQAVFSKICPYIGYFGGSFSMCIEVCCEVLAQMCFASCVDNALTKQEVARQKEEEEERKLVTVIFFYYIGRYDKMFFNMPSIELACTLIWFICLHYISSSCSGEQKTIP